MLGKRPLVLDTFCEVYDLILHLANETFYDFTKHTIRPGAVYLFGRMQFNEHAEQIKQLAQDGVILPVLSNPAEGSETMRWQIERLGITDLVKEGKILVITGGFLPEDIPSLYYENFMPKLLDYEENVQAQQEYRERWTSDRPYKFLFLNGRGRPHRKLLIEKLHNLLDQCLWTNLDWSAGPIHLLPPKYEYKEFVKYGELPDQGFIKPQLMPDIPWPEVYIKAEPYLDTYFSLITETVFYYPHTFRTEKIWKPICVGHPWIAASSAGYYRDMHKIGFQTFGHLIDESFDSIDNDQDRLDRIAAVVNDLCAQDLSSFVTAAEDVCKYNQQHLAELSQQVRQEFPKRFTDYFNERS